MVGLGAVSIVGNGNAAWQLAQQFYNSNIPVRHIFSRNQAAGESLANLVASEWKSLEKGVQAELLFLCLPEDAVPSVIQQYPIQAEHVLHCSGSLSMEALSTFSSYGVFYPLQTMTKGRLLSPKQIPICIEANNASLEQGLVGLAEQVGFPWTKLSSTMRKRAHVSAVMVNNFSNHLWHKAAQLAEANNVDMALLGPLLTETLEKFQQLGGKGAQTGPARRGDTHTITEHLDLLAQYPKAQDIYELFSESIQDEFKT